jgi:hypothetical protein
MRQFLERQSQNALKLGLQGRVVELCRPVNDWTRITPILVEGWKDLVERDLLMSTRAVAALVVGGVRRDSVDP